MIEFENIRFEDFITNELKEKQKTLSIVRQKEMTARYNLSRTDYQAIKFAEGELTVEEYTEVKAQRSQWRKEVNEYSAQAKTLKLEYQQLYVEAKEKYQAKVKEYA